MIDPDLVRVDLLRVRRKIYNSYPEGSTERKEFLLVSKLNEIKHLSKVVPPEMANLVLEEYKFQTRYELIDVVINLGMAISLGLLLKALHNLYPKNSILLFWFLPSLAFLINGGRHFWHLAASWYIMRRFKKEYGMVKDQIKKLSEDVKRIGDGK